ncbi:mitochondrial acetylornithine aminotransferase [Drechslerella stenobrocha 248]|uniref:Mitochondrial acetylornithine aminotransferase n=1 Tax=Drechslerella stenobrocha 248 TaxID=1043628 RepID=W7I9G6_9PEZI|nr:mitochondrial acetylornithine aminotransferase [Drechslerella stenobrocha 248]
MAHRLSIGAFGALGRLPVRAAVTRAPMNRPTVRALASAAEAAFDEGAHAPRVEAGEAITKEADYMVATYSRPNIMFKSGKGSYLWDTTEKKYLDFTAGIAVNSLGHADEGVTSVIADQAQRLIHACNLYHNPWTGELSRLIVETTLASGAMADASRVFICNSGSEANEAAIKFARKVGKSTSDTKTEFVSFHNSFHGRTMGSLSATPTKKYQAPFGPMLPGFRYGDLNDISALPGLVTAQTCGVIVEPIQGEGGIHTATPEFMVALRRRCDEVGAVLIYDEIQCGLGRTGELWAHAALPREAHPDILTTAKALGNGVPIGATMVTEKVAQKIVVGDHGTTFGGNPLAARVAHHVFARLADAEMLGEVRRKGEVFKRGLEGVRARYPGLVGEIAEGLKTLEEVLAEHAD